MICTNSGYCNVRGPDTRSIGVRIVYEMYAESKVACTGNEGPTSTSPEPSLSTALSIPSTSFLRACIPSSLNAAPSSAAWSTQSDD
jgi:hypothetical protein